MKKSIKKKIIGFTIMLLFIGGALTASTYAWFTTGKIVTVTPFNVNVSARGSLKIAPGIVTDVNSVLFNTNLDFGDVSSFSKAELSGNGTVFYKPTDTTNTEFTSSINTTTDYIEKNFTFLYDEPKDIYLSSESLIIDTVGSLSPAARIAFYEYVSGVPELRFVWAPNTIQAVNEIKYINDTTGTTSYISNAVVSGLPVLTADGTTPVGTVGKILTVDTTSQVPVTKSIKIVIWVDGSDPSSNSTNLSENNNAIWRAGISFAAFNTV